MNELRPDPTEATLVALARSGNPQAFEHLVRDHQAHVYRLALRMLGDQAEAEDASQDAFLQAWRGLSRFRGESGFGTWLHRITLNRCLRLLHVRGSRVPIEDTSQLPDGTSVTPDPERQVEIRTALRELGRSLDRLTPEQRAAFVLRHLEDRPYVEISALLGISVPAVKSRIHRARLEVLAAMEEAEA